MLWRMVLIVIVQSIAFLICWVFSRSASVTCFIFILFYRILAIAFLGFYHFLSLCWLNILSFFKYFIDFFCSPVICPDEGRCQASCNVGVTSKLLLNKRLPNKRPMTSSLVNSQPTYCPQFYCSYCIQVDVSKMPSSHAAKTQNRSDDVTLITGDVTRLSAARGRL